jgi:hypothetical protein
MHNLIFKKSSVAIRHGAADVETETTQLCGCGDHTGVNFS